MVEVLVGVWIANLFHRFGHNRFSVSTQIEKKNVKLGMLLMSIFGMGVAKNVQIFLLFVWYLTYTQVIFILVMGSAALCQN